jgi:hemoglobin-like flavoprotein
MNKIRNEKEERTEREKIQKITRTYYKSLFSTKLKNLDKMDKFLDRYQITKLIQDLINDINSWITPKKIEAVINSLSNKQANKNQTNKARTTCI